MKASQIHFGPIIVIFILTIDGEGGEQEFEDLAFGKHQKLPTRRNI